MLSHPAFVLAMTVSLTGCIKEDRDDCSHSHTLTVRAYDNSGSELSRSDVRDVVLYVFDDGLRFVGRIDTRVGQPVAVSAPKGEEVHIVGWGNLGGGLQSCTEPGAGGHKDDFRVELLPHTRALSYALSPGDLFRGEITLTGEGQGGERILPVYRETGSMAVVVRNLKHFTGFDDGFSIEVRDTRSAVDFHGKPAGGRVAYRPAGSFRSDGFGGREYHVPPFNLLPEESDIHIDIYHGTDLVATVSQDSSGNPVTVKKGLLTNVLVDLRSAVAVSVSLTPWGEEQLWKEF